MALLNTIPDGFRTTFSDALAAALKAELPTFFAEISADSLSATIQAKVSECLPDPLSLTQARPDFESVMAQLMTEIGRTNDWADAGLAGTGQMFLRMFAADVTYGQFSIARALQEAYPDLARSDNSVFAAAISLGNRLTRRVPAQVRVTLTRQTDPNTLLVIPAWTQFAVSDTYHMFNREPIQFNPSDITVDTVLYEGVLTSSEVLSLGVNFMTLEVGTETGAMSDLDFRLYVDGEEWTRVTDPLWHFSATDKVFFENTTANGNVRVEFGNNKTGAVPASGATIRAEWVETLGDKFSDARTNLSVTIPSATTDLGTITGVTTTPLARGMPALDADFFRMFGSNRRAAQKRSVIRRDYRANAAGQFPGIKDAYFKGQAETFPNKPSYMNIVHAVILSDPVLSPTDWKAFEAFMRETGIFQTKMIRVDAAPKDIDVVADVFCRSDATLAEVRTILLNVVKEAFKPHPGSLGYSWYRDDLHKLLRSNPSTVSVVEYVILRAPTQDVIVSGVEEWVRLNSVQINVSFTRRGSYEGRLDQHARVISSQVDGQLIVD